MITIVHKRENLFQQTEQSLEDTLTAPKEEQTRTRPVFSLSVSDGESIGLWDFMHKPDEPDERPPSEPPSPNNGCPPSLTAAQAGAAATSANSFALSEGNRDSEGTTALCDEAAWLYTVQRLRSAVREALVRAGRPTLPAEPVRATPTRASLSMIGLVKAVAWRVEALELQLRPTGAISFRPMQPFEDAPKRCSLCGGAQYPGVRWVCPERQVAKNLVLGFLEVDEWLCLGQPKSETL